MLKSTEIIEDVDNKQYQRQKEEGGLPPVCEFAFQMVGNQGEQDVFEQEGAFAGQYDAVDQEAGAAGSGRKEMEVNGSEKRQKADQQPAEGKGGFGGIGHFGFR